MSLGLVGRKVGMTRIFTDDGAAVPVTVLDVANNRVTQIKTPDNDGYAAIQVTYGKRRASRVTKAAADSGPTPERPAAGAHRKSRTVTGTRHAKLSGTLVGSVITEPNPLAHLVFRARGFGVSG